MKTRIAVAAIVLLAAGSALAGSPAPHHGPRGADIERLAVLLDLDEGQKVAVKDVLDTQRAERRAAMKQARESGTRPSREEMRAKREQAQKETVEKLRGILSDQQLKKFEVLTEKPPRGPHDGKHRKVKPEQSQ